MRDHSPEPGLPFEHLNLRFNPFGERPLEERGQLAVPPDYFDDLPDLTRPGFALQVLGDKGRGKTTHLLALRERYPRSQYLHIPEEGLQAWPPSLGPSPFFIDEAQRLTWLQRRDLFRPQRSLVIGSHADHAKQLRRAGFTVQTRQAFEELSPERLHAMIQKRIESARRADGDLPRVTKENCDLLLSHFGTDVRGIEGYLYEIFQGLEGPCHVELRNLD
jgi:hypothetical protein